MLKSDNVRDLLETINQEAAIGREYTSRAEDDELIELSPIVLNGIFNTIEVTIDRCFEALRAVDSELNADAEKQTVGCPFDA